MSPKKNFKTNKGSLYPTKKELEKMAKDLSNATGKIVFSLLNTYKNLNDK